MGFIDGRGFASSLDADSEGKEEGFYVRQEHEINTNLGPLEKEFKVIYDVTYSGNWEINTTSSCAIH